MWLNVRQIRNAKSTKQSTRVWSQVHTLDAQVKAIVATYNYARDAWEKLGYIDPNYPPIIKSDLQMPADITEANRIGQRSYKLPWFWRIGNQVEENDSSEQMKDCECTLNK
jgi:hypothetical protein